MSPLHEEISRPIEREYYWTAAQSEYATDVMFRDRGALERIYPTLVHHAVMSFGAEQVMRYVGRSGRVGINDEVVTDRRASSFLRPQFMRFPIPATASGLFYQLWQITDEPIFSRCGSY